ncbi:LytTR family DNA-binding domain-containing protein [Undibacterium cyanobacteriorum]|uniref:LytTR family DNA-binding domain-containing protein n=1 Tax=Undibacterium cyanobacteriorum TaxID=3073561 RepID=A0ABY9RMT1_9BURK|nr:LytTR family DNA-binding domain-containing protein [Undibacterium sp. 20NA77.5]WMW82198.1 LytTR family DNA-binding domain-containing protein [Undibacterium sp. 20NA77.5]
MPSNRPTALIADDEPLLRSSLIRMLAQIWPELEIVAEARNGREAIEQYQILKPTVCFLDVHMPGITGIDAARQIGRGVHLVFVTAYSEYAVEAFTQGALDYLVKPVDPARLADTVARLRERIGTAQDAPDIDALLDKLEARMQKKTAPEPLRWIKAMVGQSLRMIPVASIDFLRSDEKYTLIAWRGEDGKAAEALIRSTLKELLDQLDTTNFIQVHRSVVVNINMVSHVNRGENETATIFMKGRDDKLPVSRSYLHHFKQM